MMETLIHLGMKPVLLKFVGFDEEIDLDELTSIDYSNIYGEAVTISALLSKFGIMRAEAERHVTESKLLLEIYEAKQKKYLRKLAALNAGKIKIDDEVEIKLTENLLIEQISIDPEFAKLKRDLAEAKKNYDYIDAIFWAASSKDKKLNNIVKAVTPEELYNELVEGTINGIMVKKGRMRHN